MELAAFSSSLGPRDTGFAGGSPSQLGWAFWSLLQGWGCCSRDAELSSCRSPGAEQPHLGLPTPAHGSI